MPPSRNLLLCFDAFGTLFKPRQPIGQQYADVARSFGLGGFSNDDVAKSFKEAFQKESKANPNFGKANGLNPEKWWTNIITNTFQPLIPPKQDIPKDFVPKLIHRFWCDEGYTLFPDVLPLVKRIREAHRSTDDQVVIGVITNSDDRVPDILKSFGMRVGSLRYGSNAHSESSSGDEHDIDFAVMSYDVGAEKPDKRIFTAAEEVLQVLLDSEATKTEHDLSQWRKVYIGDEYDKDVVGALEAGWNAVLIDRETTRGRKEVSWLDPKPPGDLYNTFKSCKAVGFGSLAKLAEWLPSKTS
ncbi:uncharacterized hydrolase [Lecanosticta acicola]|uniref:Uncharacterized hydrolase n=1 Tax=Lecanosticta acicola TaxID=111012 RepID=A0AAI8Z3S0_9PEZI|nr:uncharacterized hydrolase [Lecanosticta acicola]